MKRTITISSTNTKYRDMSFGRIIPIVTRHFKIDGFGEYVITITEGSKYRFVPIACGVWHIIEIANAELEHEKQYGIRAGSIGGICIDAFRDIFFDPDVNKTYNITAKKIE